MPLDAAHALDVAVERHEDRPMGAGGLEQERVEQPQLRHLELSACARMCGEGRGLGGLASKRLEVHLSAHRKAGFSELEKRRFSLRRHGPVNAGSALEVVVHVATSEVEQQAR